MDLDILKKLFVGTATTSVALACLAALTDSATWVKYGLLGLLCLVQYAFYRQLTRANQP
jgi:hypothetical protein